MRLLPSLSVVLFSEFGLISQVRCYSPDHMFWLLVLCVPMVVFYVLGIPLVSAWLLYRHRDQLQTPDVKRRYYFLYTGYERLRWYWEYVIVVRKVALVGISVFFQYSARLQAFSALMLLVFCLAAHIHGQPFVDTKADMLEFLSLSVSFFTFFCGILLWSPDLAGLARIAVSFLIVGINFCFLAYAARLSYKSTQSYFKQHPICGGKNTGTTSNEESSACCGCCGCCTCGFDCCLSRDKELEQQAAEEQNATKSAAMCVVLD